VTSIDVVFDEENTWDWNIHQSTPILINNEVEEAAATPKISEISTEAVDEISPPVLEEIDAPDQPLRRARRRLVWMIDYKVTGIHVNKYVSNFALFADYDPTTFENAVKEEKWRKAMDDEIDAIERNSTWELSDLPKGHKTIGDKWVYKTKLKENGEIDKYKA